MSVGARLLDLTGSGDPREKLLSAILGASGAATPPASGGAGGAQYAGGGAGAGGATAPAPAAPAGAPAGPTGFESPPDFANIYAEMLKYQSKAQSIDRGFGLIGSAISQDGNREATLSAFTGGNGSGVGVPDPSAIASTAMELQKANIARQQRAAMLASLPMIARKYGLDLETAKMLYEQGKLEEVIAEREKPNVELVTSADGTIIAVDKTKSQQTGTFGGKKDMTEVIDGPNGSKVLFDNESDQVLGNVTPRDASNDYLEYTDYVNNEAKLNPDKPPMSFQEFRMTKPPSTQITNNVGQKLDPESEAFAGKSGQFFAEDYQNLRKARNQARDMLGQYELARKAVDTNVRTGTLGEYEQSLRKLGLAMGLDTDIEKVTGGELLKTVTNRMALLMRNPDSGMGMPGSVSDRDLTFLKEAQVGLTTANPKAMIEVFERLEKRKIDIANLADKYVKEKGKLDANFDEVVRDFAEKNPLFEGIELVTPDPSARRTQVFEKYGLKPN